MSHHTDPSDQAEPLNPSQVQQVALEKISYMHGFAKSSTAATICAVYALETRPLLTNSSPAAETASRQLPAETRAAMAPGPKASDSLVKV